MSKDCYESPLSSRYASKEMKYIFSPDMKFRTWRKLWIALAESEMELGLPITQEQIDELKANADNINYEVAEAREKLVRHDVMSHVYAYGQQCPKAKGIIHLGATSCYVGDNTDVIIMTEGLKLVRNKLVTVIRELAKFADKYKDLPTLAFTHFQPAQPTTVGKRASLWLQELLMDLEDVEYQLSKAKLLGCKGTTGTQASFLELFEGDHEKCKELDRRIAKKMGYSACFAVSGQTYSRKLDTQDSVCTLPVFGQYKDGKGFLCVIEKGAEQAQLLFKRTSPYVTGCAAFTVIDNGIYQMKSKTDTTLFSSEASLEGISAEYILISDTSEEGAYSEMAGIYRERLKEEGVLSDKVPASSPKLLAELIGSVEYNTHFLGVIPSQKEFALTDYEQMSDIAKELNSTVGEGNLTCLISGWNKNGLNAQKPGTVSLSGALGSKSGFTKLISAFRDNKISYFVNLEFVSANPARLFGYSSFSQSARSLNNGIVKLSYLDSVSCQWEESGRQLISSTRYMKISDSYSKKADGFDGIGVSELSSMLYGDYSNSETVTRAQSSRAVEETLSSLCESHRLIGNGGNLYALEYLSFVDGLSEIPQEYTFSRRIPFVQMVLHGYIPYTSRDMNSEEDSRTALLKRIEYGENLRYTLTANSFDKLYETDFSSISNTRYSGLKADIDENYKALSKALDGLMDKEIVSHRALSDSVVRVEYEGGSEIYVNYGDTDYTAEGITVNAKDFLRK